MILLRIAAALLLPLAAACAPLGRPQGGSVAIAALPPVILVSIDGFRPDYLRRGVTPNLDAFAAAGVRGDGMRPSFPSVTFPNHYTLVTGRRPDEHGIVANTMEDARIPGVQFNLANHDALVDRRWWDGAEPVWVTAEKRGVRTATMFWPGSEAAIRGVRPSYWKQFDGKLPPDARVDTLLGWLDTPAPARPRFLTLYFDDVDHAGHEKGPAAAETTTAIARVDTAFGRLLAGLTARHVVANIVVVSDHGMAATVAGGVIRLDRLLPAGSFRAITSGTSAGAVALPGQSRILARALLTPRQHMRCWPKAGIPARFHYGHNPRVPPFFCLADVGWLIAADEKGGEQGRGGAHGYDNAAPEMRATFLAAGPAFRAGTRIATFDNVDVYPLVMKLAGLKPLRSDGDLRPFRRILTRRLSADVRVRAPARASAPPGS